MWPFGHFGSLDVPVRPPADSLWPFDGSLVQIGTWCHLGTSGTTGPILVQTPSNDHRELGHLAQVTPVGHLLGTPRLGHRDHHSNGSGPGVTFWDPCPTNGNFRWHLFGPFWGSGRKCTLLVGASFWRTPNLTPKSHTKGHSRVSLSMGFGVPNRQIRWHLFGPLCDQG
jgi:hypothetical protein